MVDLTQFLIVSSKIAEEWTFAFKLCFENDV